MPGRNVILANDQTYHIFNRGIASQPIFWGKRDYGRAIETIFYYQNRKVPIRYSKFLKLSINERLSLLNELRKKSDWLVEIISYCLMPNHFHLLIKQVFDNGISKFISDFTNSYTRYINTKKERKGPILEGKFKSVRIENDNQLLHIHRYIHLNPYTGYIVQTDNDLANYPFSSLYEYLSNNNNYCQKETILSNFKTLSSYKNFIFDQKDYQRYLGDIKHLVFE